MRIEYLSPSEIIPYENNPRRNEQAVDAVANSIKEFGFKNPIIVDKNNIVIAGHTRLKASEKLGLDKVPVIRAEDLTEEQVRAFRLADNKVSELAGWDFTALDEELAGITDIDMTAFGFEVEDIEEKQNPYTTAVNIPQYEPSEEETEIGALCNKEKFASLLEDIENSNVSEEEKEFLRLSAHRHIIFDYKAIANYYATASKEMQRLMEDSALVIIDVNDAIAKGYAVLRGSIEEIAFDGGIYD